MLYTAVPAASAAARETQDFPRAVSNDPATLEANSYLARYDFASIDRDAVIMRFVQKYRTPLPTCPPSAKTSSRRRPSPISLTISWKRTWRRPGSTPPPSWCSPPSRVASEPDRKGPAAPSTGVDRERPARLLRAPPTLARTRQTFSARRCSKRGDATTASRSATPSDSGCGCSPALPICSATIDVLCVDPPPSQIGCATIWRRPLSPRRSTRPQPCAAQPSVCATHTANSSLIHWDGLTIVEAAELLRLNASTARGRYAGARTALREALQDTIEDPHVRC